jgi:hypothetical protein
MSEPSASSSATAVRGALALAWTGKRLPLQVLRSAAGQPSARKTTKAGIAGVRRLFPTHLAAQRAWIPMPGRSALSPDSPLQGVSHESVFARRRARSDGAGTGALRRYRRRFFEAWKRGAQIAGHEWFGDGTREGLQRATTKWDLRPNMLMLNDALGVLSSGQRMFLSAMVSFYNAREGGAMLKRCGFEGLSDFGGLDLERRQVIADLTLHYNGW